MTAALAHDHPPVTRQRGNNLGVTVAIIPVGGRGQVERMQLHRTTEPTTIEEPDVKTGSLESHSAGFPGDGREHRSAAGGAGFSIIRS